MKLLSKISVALSIFIIVFASMQAEASNRKGSHRVGGKNSHGKGSHYVGGR